MKSLRQKIKELPVSEFHKSCYLNLIKIPSGKVITYQGLAKLVGTKAYRAVGTAMAKNPLAPEVPCHRVIRSDGKIGNYAFGKDKKIKMLKKEGISIEEGVVKNLEKFLIY